MIPISFIDRSVEGSEGKKIQNNFRKAKESGLNRGFPSSSFHRMKDQISLLSEAEFILKLRSLAQWNLDIFIIDKKNP